MLKKTVSVLLALCAVLYCCLLPAAAEEKELGVISVKLNSDIAGLTDKDADKLIELKSDNVVYCTDDGVPLLISNYAGTQERGELKAGRSYTIYYMLRAAEGYTLPDALQEGDVEIECGKGVTVLAKQITTSAKRGEDGEIDHTHGLRIFAKVVVDGNMLQRAFGFLYDLYLKIKAWQLY